MCATLTSPRKSWEKYVDDWGNAWSTRYRRRLSPLHEQERHDHGAQPPGVLAPVVVPERQQVVEEEKAGDGEEQGRRPARQRLGDEVLDEADDARGAARLGGVLA